MIENICAKDARETAGDLAIAIAPMAVAIKLADAGTSQEEIVASLEAQFPGRLAENYYLNTAAEAVMRRIVRERARLLARDIDIRRLRAKGLPESLADRHEPAAAPKPAAASVGVQGLYD